MPDSRLPQLCKRVPSKVEEVYGYSAVDHRHDWKFNAELNDSFCPICRLWKSQLEDIILDALEERCQVRKP
jgi:hypothetical protein